MKLGIVSDSHGRVARLVRALELLRTLGAETVLHCGDFDEVAAVEPMRGWDAHCVFGNCDRHIVPQLKEAIDDAGGHWQEPFGHLTLAGVEIAWLHGDDAGLKRDLEASQAFDYIFYGHTHIALEELAGRTSVINPGALHRARGFTVGLLDLATRDYSRHAVD